MPRAWFWSLGALGFAVDDGFGEPEEFVQERSGALFVTGVVRSAVLLETVAHPGHSEIFGDRKRAHADAYESQLGKAGETAKAAGGNGDNPDGLALVFGQQIIERVFQNARVAIVIFRRDDDDRIGARDFISVLLQAWRWVVPVVQPLFHDREIIFNKIEQLGLHTLALLRFLQNEPRYFDALPVTSRAADDDGDVEHIKIL